MNALGSNADMPMVRLQFPLLAQSGYGIYTVMCCFGADT